MIDIHSHIIPGVDDGAASWEEAVRMCRMAEQDGINVLVATPHVFNGMESNGHHFEDALYQLRRRLDEEEIELEILLGAEVHCCPDLPNLLEQEISLTLNGNGRYFLLEFPHSIVPPNSDQLIFQLLTKNLIPIIVHPERNTYLQNHLDLLADFVKQGALCQITAMSVTGDFGLKAEECAHKLLKRNLVHMIASDAHNEATRKPLLSKARENIRKNFGFDKAQELFETTSRKVLMKE